MNSLHNQSLPTFIQFISHFDDDNRPQLVFIEVDQIAGFLQVGNGGSVILLKNGKQVEVTQWESEVQYILDSLKLANFVRYDGRSERQLVDRYRHEILGWPARNGRSNGRKQPAGFTDQDEQDHTGRTSTPPDRVGPGEDEDQELARHHAWDDTVDCEMCGSRTKIDDLETYKDAEICPDCLKQLQDVENSASPEAEAVPAMPTT